MKEFTDEIIQDLMESLNVYILYLPPHNHHVNTIELMLSTWKNELKAGFDSGGFNQRAETFKMKSMNNISFSEN
jgi:hypothetical protein